MPAELAAWLAAHGVLHLGSLPRTPQHNGGEPRADSGLGRGTGFASVESTAARLERAFRRLNRRPLAEMGPLAAGDQHRIAAVRYTPADRERLLAEARSAMEAAQLGTGSARARRLAARRAALAALERNGTLTQTIGSDDRHAVKTERVS